MFQISTFLFDLYDRQSLFHLLDEVVLICIIDHIYIFWKRDSVLYICYKICHKLRERQFWFEDESNWYFDYRLNLWNLEQRVNSFVCEIIELLRTLSSWKHTIDDILMWWKKWYIYKNELLLESYRIIKDRLNCMSHRWDYTVWSATTSIYCIVWSIYSK